MEEKTPEKKQIALIALSFIIIYHTVLLISLPVYFYFNTLTWGLFASLMILFVLTGLSITAGYHRLYAHRSYCANNILETVLLFFGALSIENSALKWSYDHRLHHAFVDQDKDPYSINKGFWHAHWIWIFYNDSGVSDKKVVSDLLKNKLVMFQHNHYLAITVAGNFLVTLFCGWLCDNYFGAFLFSFLLRVFCVHHCTWFINSLAHTWGDKPFSRELTAVDNYFLALLTFGEGYHNYHHTFANDYRNGIRWFHFDPTKWLIWTFHKLGYASNLKFSDPVTIKKRMIAADKAHFLEKIKDHPNVVQEKLRDVIHQISDSLIENLSKFNEIKLKYSQMKRGQISADIRKDVKHQLNLIKRHLSEEWDQWVQLSKEIGKLSQMEVEMVQG